jgi:signal transduction histidine kinase
VRKFVPSSLIGQVALVIAIALLIAQAFNFALVFHERTRATRAQFEGPALARLIGVAKHYSSLKEDQRTVLMRDLRWIHHRVDAESIVPANGNDGRLEAGLRANAAAVGLFIRGARAAVGEEPPRQWTRQGTPSASLEPERFGSLLLSVQLPDGQWFNAQVPMPKPDPSLAFRLLGPALLLYLLLLGGAVLIAARLTRPLKDLTRAADQYRGRGEAPQVMPAGPADLRRAILAFNAMGARVGAMLQEKDRMLGAIGHDLRTPLASLRVRVENMGPEAERKAAIGKIEEMTAMLQDTLELARSGLTPEPSRLVDLNALADTVVEEFRALGHDVELSGQSEDLSAQVRPDLLRRALRNLVENGINYAGKVRVTVDAVDGDPRFDIADTGPGIPEHQLEHVLEPFVRLEGSRSRGTGGSGLGLALARNAVQAHNGMLQLSNRPGGGLLARIVLPRDLSAPAG